MLWDIRSLVRNRARQSDVSAGRDTFAREKEREAGTAGPLRLDQSTNCKEVCKITWTSVNHAIYNGNVMYISIKDCVIFNCIRIIFNTCFSYSKMTGNNGSFTKKPLYFVKVIVNSGKKYPDGNILLKI